MYTKFISRSQAILVFLAKTSIDFSHRHNIKLGLELDKLASGNHIVIDDVDINHMPKDHVITKEAFV